MGQAIGIHDNSELRTLRKSFTDDKINYTMQKVFVNQIAGLMHAVDTVMSVDWSRVRQL